MHKYGRVPFNEEEQVGDITYLEKAARLGVKHRFTGVGCSGNYLTKNGLGKPVSATKSEGEEFEARVDAAERKRVSERLDPSNK